MQALPCIIHFFGGLRSNCVYVDLRNVRHVTYARRTESRRSRPSGDARSTGRCRNTLFRVHARAWRTPLASRRVVVVVGVGGGRDSAAMFRFVNKNLAVGSAEMAAMDRIGVGVGIGVVGQPVPLDVYRESHHLLALGGSVGMRGSIKHETWGREGSHLRMRMDFLDVSITPYLAPCYEISRCSATPVLSFARTLGAIWRRLSIIQAWRSRGAKIWIPFASKNFQCWDVSFVLSYQYVTLISVTYSLTFFDS